MSGPYGDSVASQSRPSAVRLADEVRRSSSRGPVVGGWSMLGSTLAVGALCGSGARWICIDLQHGERTTAVGDLVDAARAWAVPVIVRVPSIGSEAIGHVLDMGVSGVIAPMVESSDDARRFVNEMRYAPAGGRSWGPYRALLGDSAYAPGEANRALLALVMIESRAGVERIDDILAVPGVDGFVVGPTDMTLSFTGALPDGDDAVLAEQRAGLIEAARRHRAIAGYVTASAEEAERRAEEGFSLLTVSSDFALIGGGMRERLRESGQEVS